MCDLSSNLYEITSTLRFLSLGHTFLLRSIVLYISLHIPDWTWIMVRLISQKKVRERDATSVIDAANFICQYLLVNLYIYKGLIRIQHIYAHEHLLSTIYQYSILPCESAYSFFSRLSRLFPFFFSASLTKHTYDDWCDTYYIIIH